MGTVPGRVGTITTSYFLDLLGETMALIAINKVTEEGHLGDLSSY